MKATSFFVAFLSLLLLPLPAFADFVQTTTCNPGSMGNDRCRAGEEPRPVQWFRQSIPYFIHDQGSQDIHPGEFEITDHLRNTIISSFETWNDQECSLFEMRFAGLTPDAPIGTEGGTISIENLSNVVVFRDGFWPHPGYNAVALTTVTFRPSSGEILAADIEFNTADYEFTNTEGREGAVIDVRNTLTHEAGHFLGLDHTFVTDATMFATAPPAEISKRELHPVDIEGLCSIYPLSREYEEDTDPPRGEEERRGCFRCAQSSGGPDGTMLAFLGLVAAGLILRRRREAFS